LREDESTVPEFGGQPEMGMEAEDELDKHLIF
jgi:hypothetical protein